MLFKLVCRYYHYYHHDPFDFTYFLWLHVKVIFCHLCIKIYLYQVRLCYDLPTRLHHFMIMIIQYILLIIFYKPPQKVRKVKTNVVLTMMRRFQKVSFGSEILCQKFWTTKIRSDKFKLQPWWTYARFRRSQDRWVSV